MPPVQIVVHGLPWSTEWQELKDLAKQHGDAVKADVMRRPDGKSRGFGTVVFKTPEDAQSAIEVCIRVFILSSVLHCITRYLREVSPNSLRCRCTVLQAFRRCRRADCAFTAVGRKALLSLVAMPCLIYCTCALDRNNLLAIPLIRSIACCCMLP